MIFGARHLCNTEYPHTIQNPKSGLRSARWIVFIYSTYIVFCQRDRAVNVLGCFSAARYQFRLLELHCASSNVAFNLDPMPSRIACAKWRRVLRNDELIFWSQEGSCHFAELEDFTCAAQGYPAIPVNECNQHGHLRWSCVRLVGTARTGQGGARWPLFKTLERVRSKAIL